MRRSKHKTLFYDLVGEDEQDRWDFEAERSRGSQVDH
jgi:hypothetical protein